MKKALSFLVVLFVLIFAVSCGSGKNDEEPAVETDTDTETSDTDSDDSGEPEPTDTESTDTEPSDTEQADNEPTDPCNPDPCEEGEICEPDEENGYICSPEAKDEPVEKHELIGRYSDSYGGSHIISNTAWFQPSEYGDTIFHITQFDSEKDFIIAQNDAVKSWNPEKWSRFDYTEKDGRIYYCQVVFDAETEADALAVTNADRTDPATSGCSGYPWTELVEFVEESINKDDAKIVAWATAYENYKVGDNVDEEWQTPEKALGKAEGTSTDIVVLGDGGSIVLTFDKPITDGEGADFAVFENSFDEGFLELGTVEVSSDGEHFVAFDNYYLGVEKIGSYDNSQDASLIFGFAGKFKQGEGTPFDLSELAGKPEVAAGTLDLTAVTHVKIIDVIGDGSQKDSLGEPIYDPYPTAGSAGFDLDALAVINQKD